MKRFILVIDNASFHISRKTKYFLNKQAQWLDVIYLPKRSPNLNPVEIKITGTLRKISALTITIDQKRIWQLL